MRFFAIATKVVLFNPDKVKGKEKGVGKGYCHNPKCEKSRMGCGHINAGESIIRATFAGEHAGRWHAVFCSRVCLHEYEETDVPAE